MRALTLTDTRWLQLRDRPAPTLSRDDDVIVDVAQTGICGTDRSVLVGKFPALPGVVMGHEGVGRVARVGEYVEHLRPGDRVVINPTLYCGHCPPCQHSRTNHCRNKRGTEVGIDRDGSFADQIVLPAAFIHPIPQDMSFDQATLVEPLTCALNNLLSAGLDPGDQLIVLGGGPIGATVAALAHYLGHPTTVVETDPTRRDLLAGVLPAIVGQDATPIEVVEHAGDLPPSQSVIDTVGNLLPQALDLVAPGGSVVIMGYHSHAVAQLHPLEILQRGIRIVGAGDYPGNLFPRALHIAGQLPLAALITHRFKLDEFEQAIELLSPNGAGYSALKIVIQSGPAS